ncbi:MAG: hypothetical protein AAFX08_08840 [Pseudomonadota bacterium]
MIASIERRMNAVYGMNGGVMMSDQPKTDDLDRLLGVLTEASVRQALSCLETLPRREDDGDHDRGARSVECLMRVAATAETLRGKLQKDAAHDASAKSQADAVDDDAARRLADRFDAELRRIREGSASAIPEGGRA